ncbi:MAG: SIMPL domain-containing protein [Bacteroidaceae bacterium]|nr:SIMPL domain-containing protein [Bacteroidaceae bacterium]
MKSSSYISALILAAGITLLGLFIYLGFAKFSDRDRSVSVRGLAEREVKADHVVWPVRYKITGNDLHTLYTEISEKNERIVSYLKQNGIPDTDISMAAPKINDRQAEMYTDYNAMKDRYYVTSVITVSSKKVDEVRQLTNRTGELLKQGIAVLPGDYDESSITYEFTGLNKVKPEMIEEATKNARNAAEKFAKDSGSSIGKIKNARQGLFEISNRDQFTPYIKKIRVVTNVDYYLES